MPSFSYKYFNSQTWKYVVRDGIEPNVSGHDVSGKEMLYDAVSKILKIKWTVIYECILWWLFCFFNLTMVWRLVTRLFVLPFGQ